MAGAIFKISVMHFGHTLATILLCFGVRFTLAQNRLLVEEEKNALVEIAQQLGKTDWDFSLNPCDNNTNWNTRPLLRSDMPLYINQVSCFCNSSQECHVYLINLRSQNLEGVLSPSLSKLRYLTYIDLSWNYLSGTIPPEWASLKLDNIWLGVNRLSGPIPKYLGNITTLKFLSLLNNQFNGTVPAELGKLVNLETLSLNTNDLTGELPLQLNNLEALTRLMLSDNNFTGKLPSFESWPKLEYLFLQATGLQGPLPSSLSSLTNLVDLRISDLNGGGASELPALGDMLNMQTLMLRSCNISGTIPDYLFNMPQLENLDLSFNNFEGDIPNRNTLPRLQSMYVTSNSLNGSIPEWITGNSNRLLDLSYNNFDESSVPGNCRENLNLFRSYRRGNISQLGKCLNQCSKDYYSFHVNCGGKDIKIGNTLFEGDGDDLSGPAIFVPNAMRNWGVSSTGLFPDTQNRLRDYVAQNASTLSIRTEISELYMTARLSPLSLTYYGRCLANGNYTVILHFAEIMIRNNQSFLSLGKRIFDVYIQGKKELEDFNIVQETKGVDIPYNKTFKVTVKDNILEIRFQYTGKGSPSGQAQGTYGPLISAISVESDFKPPNKGKEMMLIAIGASVLGLFLILGVIGYFWWDCYIRRRISLEEELRGLDLRKGFTYRQIKAATNNFNAENRIGKGGFGYVYKGVLLDGTLIAVKQLTSVSKQGNRDFINEVGVISALQHPNLVKLYGCCIEDNQLLLVYEYMKNNSLARALFGPEESRLEMDWRTRQKICIGIAKGLVFMHEESILKIVHRDIKPDNVLLDEHLNPKISDFGLAKHDDEENTHISTKRVAGTTGYMAPEYALWGYLTYKADVYSYGIVALEIVAGKCNMKYHHNENFVCLLDWALALQKNESLMELVDPKLGSDFNKHEVENLIRVALLCTSPTPALRPTMSEVIRLLEGNISIQEFNVIPVIHETDWNLQALIHNHDDLFQSSRESQEQSDTSS